VSLTGPLLLAFSQAGWAGPACFVASLANAHWPFDAARAAHPDP
jgi:hypothetical protein